MLGFVGGGALLVGGLAVFLQLRGPEVRASVTADPPVRDEPAPGFVGGVQALSHDSPFARDHDPADPAPPVRLAGVPQLEPAEALTDAAPADEPPPPPPPLVLSESQLAANAAHEAATAAARDQAEAALRGAHASLKRACWQPTAAAATFSYDMSFGADGKLLGLGISDSGSDGAGPVGACLRAQALDLTIAAPGQRIAVAVDLAFP